MALDHIPLTITVYTKGYVRKGVVAAPTSVSVSINHNAPGTAEFTVDADHARISDLTAYGARAVVAYRYAPSSDPVVLISGPVGDTTGEGPADSAVRKFVITDDWAEIFNGIIGWPNPTGTVSQQGDDSAYFTRTGPAETVVKQIVAPNATRQGLPLTVPATEGRGAKITVSVRMHPLADKIFPAADQAGIGVRVLQLGTERTLTVYTPKSRARVLTEESGIVVGGSWQIKPPTVTRVTIGAGGEGKLRAFYEYVDAARESTYGIRRSAFIDARDAYSDVDSATKDLADRVSERKAAEADYKRLVDKVNSLTRIKANASNTLDEAKATRPPTTTLRPT
jgi:hypothetical protein